MEDILSELKSLSEKDLVALNDQVIKQIKRVRSAKAKAMKMSLQEGDNVRWVGKSGSRTGEIVHVWRKYAKVRANDDGCGIWRVPLSMLKKG